MGNMSYCRFRKTEPDLRDCFENFDDILPEEEHRARTKLYKLCRRITENFDLDELEDLIETE